MTLPVDTPKLPKWPFLLGDALLLGTAWMIAHQSRDAFAGGPLIAVTTCVALGALLGVIPFLSDYARKQDEALDDRQRSLESLSRTVAASSEQISIAAGGLHEITEIAHRNLKAAEQLPHKLQEKIAEFKAELENANSEEREELEKELATLRAGESERLESIADKIAKATAEFSKLEASAQKHVTAGAEAIAKASAAASQATGNLQEKLGAALAQLEAKLAALDAASHSLKTAAAAPVRTPAHPAENAVRPAKQPVPAPIAPEATPSEPTPAIVPTVSALPPETSLPVESTSNASASTPVATAEVAPPVAASPEPAPKAERKRAPRKPKAEASPSVDATLPLDAEKSAAAPIENSGPKSEPAAASDDSFQLTPDEPSADPAGAEPTERAISADGATRLIATAYIGIGNRLFIRGDGPGLSWDKGVPLQFVSIGKWRWETADATAPISFKLYKNDELECAGLGSQTLDPGHQHELTAKF